MIYDSGKMLLKEVRVVLKNPVNDVLICQDMKVAGGVMYTLIVLKDHHIVKQYLEIFEEAEQVQKAFCVDSFSMGGDFCMVLPYRKERFLMDFYMGESYSLTECEDICINFVLTCLTAGVPYPILYLILTQNQIHLAKDHSVYFTYGLDMTELDPDIAESDCVVQCARILMELLRSKETLKAASFVLLKKKVEKKSYHQFTELYKDVRIAAVSKKKTGIGARIHSFFMRNRDRLFRILAVVCVVLAVLMVISLISQLIFGEVVWLRLLVNRFKYIGTESLLQ